MHTGGCDSTGCQPCPAGWRVLRRLPGGRSWADAAASSAGAAAEGSRMVPSGGPVPAAAAGAERGCTRSWLRAVPVPPAGSALPSGDSQALSDEQSFAVLQV